MLYQAGVGLRRSKLAGSVSTRHELRKLLSTYVKARPIRWRRAGENGWHEARGPVAAARQMMRALREGGVERVLADRAGTEVAAYRYRDDVALPSVPALAKLTGPTRRTLKFHREISLVVPASRPLGLYVPRPLKDDATYWSEHAWAGADDFGGDNEAGTGYEPEGQRLTAILTDVHDYTLANFTRLGVVDHIFDGSRYQPNDEGRPERSPYIGSDQHDTHTHTAFGDHDGRKPPWV